MVSPRKQNLRIGISDLEQWSHFPLKCIFICNILTDLNVDFFAAPHRYKIYFFLI